jgi:hypothetical protein
MPVQFIFYLLPILFDMHHVGMGGWWHQHLTIISKFGGFLWLSFFSTKKYRLPPCLHDAMCIAIYHIPYAQELVGEKYHCTHTRPWPTMDKDRGKCSYSKVFQILPP